MSDEERPETTATRRTTTGVRGWAVRAVAVVCLVALALALVFQWAPHVNLGLAALVLLAATLVLTVGPKQAGFLARSVSRVELMGASVEFGRAVENAEAAARQTAGDEPDSEADPARATYDVVELRLALERKLAYVAKELLADPCGDHTHPTFVTVGSLGYDRLITDAQARTLSRLQTLSDQELRQQDGAAVEAFLANAARVVGRLRATVFRNLVARELRAGGWVRRRGRRAACRRSPRSGYARTSRSWSGRCSPPAPPDGRPRPGGATSSAAGPGPPTGGSSSSPTGSGCRHRSRRRRRSGRSRTCGPSPRPRPPRVSGRRGRSGTAAQAVEHRRALLDRQARALPDLGVLVLRQGQVQLGRGHVLEGRHGGLVRRHSHANG